MMNRKLSLEERIGLFNLTRHPVFSGSRDNPVVKTVNTYHEHGHLAMDKDRTVENLMRQLDKDCIPDTTNCPYPLQFIADYVERNKQRIDLVRVTQDRKLKATSPEMQSRALDMALDGVLKRVVYNQTTEVSETVYTLKDNNRELELIDGDMFFVQPDVYQIFAAWTDTTTLHFKKMAVAKV
ncbi:hypothetical protein [Pseudomonas phage D6]|nr:hypothetical protein [Pseudomonas phage D6]